MSQPVFKSYAQSQILLMPPELGSLIAKDHPVRIVNEIINKLDIDLLLKQYKGGGTSSYHPRMMLKVLVYSYLRNVYSSREIESSLKENIHYMWLSGKSYPDHSTINRFRSNRLKHVLKEVFSQVVLLLSQQGVLNIKDIYLDGTKVEANANRYTFVWGKKVSKEKAKIKEQLEHLWAYAEQLSRKEDMDKSLMSFEQIDADKLEQAIGAINEALKDKPIEDPEIKKNFVRQIESGPTD